MLLGNKKEDFKVISLKILYCVSPLMLKRTHHIYCVCIYMCIYIYVCVC